MVMLTSLQSDLVVTYTLTALELWMTSRRMTPRNSLGYATRAQISDDEADEASTTSEPVCNFHSRRAEGLDPRRASAPA